MRRGWRNVVSILANLPFVLAAMVWRACLRKTTVIAITGSLGKTTAKECLAAILAGVAPTIKTLGNDNGRRGLPRTILRIRPWHRFAVVEVGTDSPGKMIRSSLTLRPDVVVVLNVARTHTPAYRDLDHIAQEKSRLMRFMRRNGIVILNAGDERVRALKPAGAQRVFFFGASRECAVRGEDAASEWPGRLEFTALSDGESCRVRTQLVGKHWLDCALAGLTVAKVLGVSLEKAAQGLAAAPPYTGRMSPWPLANGAVLLRDDYNGSVDSFERAVDVLRDARADRKILVMTDCSDFRLQPKRRMFYYADVAHRVADVVVFIGERCDRGVERAVNLGMRPENARGFHTLAQAAEFLKRELRSGDLALIRGQGFQHLARLSFLLEGTIACTRENCDKRNLCDICPKLQFRRSTPAE